MAEFSYNDAFYAKSAWWSWRNHRVPPPNNVVWSYYQNSRFYFGAKIASWVHIRPFWDAFTVNVRNITLWDFMCDFSEILRELNNYFTLENTCTFMIHRKLRKCHSDQKEGPSQIPLRWSKKWLFYISCLFSKVK